MNLRTALVLLISGLGIITQPSLADPITFTISLIDVPGSASTTAIAINNASQIVGTYTDSMGAGHGFLDTDGTFTTLDFPGSTFTEATGINNVGQIVGFYSGGAFLYANGTYTNLNIPASINAFGGFSKLAINDVGQIVGSTRDSRAFVYANGQVTFLPPYTPISPGSTAQGINNAGAIVGLTSTLFSTAPYVYANGQYQLIGSDTATAYGINNAGDILVYTELTNGSSTCLISLTGQNTRGCLPQTDPIVVTFPGRGFGLNDSDQIVGSYDLYIHKYGFLATPVPEPTSFLLFAWGLAGVGLLLRRRKAQ
jgi:hypothetical protein